MKKKTSFISIVGQVEDHVAVKSIRNGLVNMIPVLIIGAFALILETFPIAAYQRFIHHAAGGLLLELLELVYAGTFSVLSVYMTVFVSRAYLQRQADTKAPVAGGVSASVLSFFLLAGANLPDFGTDKLGPKSMFLAILAGLGASAIYLRTYRYLIQHFKGMLSRGADKEFNRSLSTLGPIAVTALCFAAVDVVLTRVFQVDSFHALMIAAFNRLFSLGSSGFWKGFFFVLLSSVLWFFGVHGSDTLEGVMETYFIPQLAVNQAAVAAGQQPTAILTKEFFDCFVLMGGCGATICLLIAILLVSRNRARRDLGYAAVFPMLFNINEIMVFGLPIIFNPLLLVPFLCVPLVCYSVAYLAISTGMVPMITQSVTWTTPVLLGGYVATQSVAGSLLQLVNVALGVAIYIPFVRLLDRQSEGEERSRFAAFMAYFRANEQKLTGVRLVDQNDIYGDFAKALCAELRSEMNRQVLLYYQPQYHYDGRCIGVEALLRWEHPVYGMLYPPLVVKLAEEGGFLPGLEETILSRAINDREQVLRQFGAGTKLSVNVTGSTVVSQRFLQFCRGLNAKVGVAGKNLCLEVTEQAAVAFNQDTRAALLELRSLGFALAIDDFSMGQTSVNYLKDGLFDLIKLDGSLVRGLLTQQNCREIVSSIAGLASSLGMTVLAEYVESAEQREELHRIGCDVYQGYLYSPAVALRKVG